MFMEFPATAQFLEAALYLSKVLEKASDEKKHENFFISRIQPYLPPHLFFL